MTNHIIALQKKDLAASNDLKNKLLSILSHDLRGPIKRLLVILNLWKGRKINKNELLDFTQKIEIEIETTASLMDNLLFWSKSKLEGNHKTYQVANAYDIVKETIAIFKDQMAIKKIRCQNLIDPSKAIQTDVNLLSLCLRNTISNAIKFTPKNGIIEIGLNSTNEFAEFFVSDSGVGMSCEAKKKLYSLNFESRIGTDGEQGSGMGLFIVKEFLENEGGYIECISNPGKGTTFKFGLPLIITESNEVP